MWDQIKRLLHYKEDGQKWNFNYPKLFLIDKRQLFYPSKDHNVLFWKLKYINYLFVLLGLNWPILSVQSRVLFINFVIDILNT